MRKPTLHDVARVAGVSYATADRVLNARGGVAQKSALRVTQAIETLGYERDLHAANLSRGRIYHFHFLLPGGDHSFFRTLRDQVAIEAEARKSDRIRCSITEFPALDSEALAKALLSLPPGCDALCVVAAETPQISAALARLCADGLPVVTLVGDAAAGSRNAYVGIDNVKAGRTAGRLIAQAHRQREGLVLPVIGTLSARDHRDRLAGAKAVLSTGSCQLLPEITVDDRPDLMQSLVSQALKDSPRISAIYSIGAGNRGLIEVLAAVKGERPYTLAHDLTPTTRTGLERGLIDAVIDQQPALEIAAAIETMKALCDGRWSGSGREILPTVFLTDNLPSLPLAEASLTETSQPDTIPPAC